MCNNNYITKGMERKYIVCLVLLFLPIVIQCIQQSEIIQHSLTDAGFPNAIGRLPDYRTILGASTRNHIRFAVKAPSDVLLLLSEIPISSIDINVYNHVEMCIGGWSNSKTLIADGIIPTNDDSGSISTPNILDGAQFRHFFLSWSSGLITIGHGFVIGKDVILQKSVPTTIDFKYLGVWNGYGSDGEWKFYEGT